MILVKQGSTEVRGMYDWKTADQAVNQLVVAYTLHLLRTQQLGIKALSESVYRERLEALGLSEEYIESALKFARQSVMLLADRPDAH